MANDMPVLIFEVSQGSTQIHTAEFTEPSITIGSGSSALLQLSHPDLTELHAVINVEADGSIALLDLGSDSGVHFNGARISNADLRI